MVPKSWTNAKHQYLQNNIAMYYEWKHEYDAVVVWVFCCFLEFIDSASLGNQLMENGKLYEVNHHFQELNKKFILINQTPRKPTNIFTVLNYD